MMNSFVSPQTGSAFKVVATVGDVIVGFREIEDGKYRVRIQGTTGALEQTRPAMYQNWGAVKGGDHLSCIVDRGALVSALLDAIRGVLITNDGWVE